MWLLANGPVSFLTKCVLFWEMDLVYFGWERVNPLCYGQEKVKPVYVVPVGICWFVLVKKEKSTAKNRINPSLEYLIHVSFKAALSESTLSKLPNTTTTQLLKGPDLSSLTPVLSLAQENPESRAHQDKSRTSRIRQDTRPQQRVAIHTR